MKGRFYLVILLALVTVFSGINILTQRYNQLSNENIPGAVELNNSDKTYKMAFFGSSYSFDKQNLNELLGRLKEKVPIEQARLKDFGENLLLTGKGSLRRQ